MYFITHFYGSEIDTENLQYLGEVVDLVLHDKIKSKIEHKHLCLIPLLQIFDKFSHKYSNKRKNWIKKQISNTFELEVKSDIDLDQFLNRCKIMLSDLNIRKATKTHNSFNNDFNFRFVKAKYKHSESPEYTYLTPFEILHDGYLFENASNGRVAIFYKEFEHIFLHLISQDMLSMAEHFGLDLEEHDKTNFINIIYSQKQIILDHFNPKSNERESKYVVNYDEGDLNVVDIEDLGSLKAPMCLSTIIYDALNLNRSPKYVQRTLLTGYFTELGLELEKIENILLKLSERDPNKSHFTIETIRKEYHPQILLYHKVKDGRLKTFACETLKEKNMCPLNNASQMEKISNILIKHNIHDDILKELKSNMDVNETCAVICNNVHCGSRYKKTKINHPLNYK